MKPRRKANADNAANKDKNSRDVIGKDEQSF